MPRLIIDGSRISTMNQLYEVFAQGLSFPEWYGRNFDALYDCLTDISFPVEICLIKLDQLECHIGTAMQVLVRVLIEASIENSHLKLIYI